MTEMDWDKELSSREVFKLRPEIAALRTRTSLTRKVEYLEEAARSAKKARTLDVKKFKSRSALRSWSDPSLKLWAWSDGEVDKWSEGRASEAPGRYEQIMARWRNAYDTIKALQDTSLSGLEQTIREKDLVISNLEKQVLSLMDQLDRANRRL